jgi:hypothetical protein
MILVRLFDCDCKIFNLVISFSTIVFIHVKGGINDGFVVSFDVRLGLGVGWDNNDKTDLLYLPPCSIAFSTHFVLHVHWLI